MISPGFLSGALLLQSPLLISFTPLNRPTHLSLIPGYPGLYFFSLTPKFIPHEKNFIYPVLLQSARALIPDQMSETLPVRPLSAARKTFQNNRIDALLP